VLSVVTGLCAGSEVKHTSSSMPTVKCVFGSAYAHMRMMARSRCLGPPSAYGLGRLIRLLWSSCRRIMYVVMMYMVMMA
jgi:hypothetical protein